MEMHYISQTTKMRNLRCKSHQDRLASSGKGHLEAKVLNTISSGLSWFWQEQCQFVRISKTLQGPPRKLVNLLDKVGLFGLLTTKSHNILLRGMGGLVSSILGSKPTSIPSRYWHSVCTFQVDIRIRDVLIGMTEFADWITATREADLGFKSLTLKSPWIFSLALPLVPGHSVTLSHSLTHQVYFSNYFRSKRDMVNKCEISILDPWVMECVCNRWWQAQFVLRVGGWSESKSKRKSLCSLMMTKIHLTEPMQSLNLHQSTSDERYS